jgi:hypothetical protein
VHVAKWCAEVIDLGDIVQDSDDSISDDDREQRLNRYVELVDAVAGDEPDEVFRCLLTSVRNQGGLRRPSSGLVGNTSL